MGPNFFDATNVVVIPSEDVATRGVRYAKGMTPANRPLKRASYWPLPAGVIVARIGPEWPVRWLYQRPFQTPVGSSAEAEFIPRSVQKARL